MNISFYPQFFRNSQKLIFMRYYLLLIILLVTTASFKPKPTYQIFKGEKGKSIDFDKMMQGLKDADVVFFGESHNNSVCHWLQLQVLKELRQATGRDVLMGAEMFEADDQLVLDEYLSGLIKESHLLNEAKLWDNYETDYKPLIEFCKSNEIPFVASNIPRRYANIVARNGLEGLDQLDDEASKYMVPLPFEIDYELAGYNEIANMMSGHMGKNNNIGKNMLDAQAIKDATMAYFIQKNLSLESVFYHINGAFHTKNSGGIIYFLKKLNPDLNVVTISMVEQKKILKLKDENIGIADYLIAIPDDMTKTY